MSPKSTLVLVHGAFHSPDCFHLIQPKLEALGYPVVAVALASVGKTHPNATYLDDVSVIHEVVLPILDEGKEVVLVTHSWGGVPGVASSEGHTLQERAARGQRGGIKSIMMIASAMIMKKGTSLSESNGASTVEWMDFEESFGICNHLAKDAFYNDLPSSEADHYFSLLRPQAVSVLFTPVHFVASNLKISKAYVICEKDNAVPVAHQEKMVDAVGGFKKIRFGGGHSPFLSQPDWIVGVIDEFAREK
ncbi:Alpha/beta hydrolase fold-1 [Rhexocercosporidium sp. MPI-PUGE-AT-0058]|nr:Alpha/beta hydrolase fold-1 [Rhexocercosporidium sp. MPI-PUGE-AT-0058]